MGSEPEGEASVVILDLVAFLWIRFFYHVEARFGFWQNTVEMFINGVPNMDKYGRLKYMTNPVKNQIILFDAQSSRFYDHAMIHMEHQNIQPFLLKPGDYVNNQPNDNGLNAKVKSL